MRRWAWHFLGFRDFAESTIYGFYICGPHTLRYVPVFRRINVFLTFLNQYSVCCSDGRRRGEKV